MKLKTIDLMLSLKKDLKNKNTMLLSEKKSIKANIEKNIYITEKRLKEINIYKTCKAYELKNNLFFKFNLEIELKELYENDLFIQKEIFIIKEKLYENQKEIKTLEKLKNEKIKEIEFLKKSEEIKFYDDLSQIAYNRNKLNLNV